MNQTTKERLELLAEILFFSIPTLIMGAVMCLVYYYTNCISISFAFACIFATGIGTIIIHCIDNETHCGI